MTLRWLPPIISWSLVVVQLYVLIRSVRSARKTDREGAAVLAAARAKFSECDALFIHMMQDHGALHRRHEHDDDKPPTVQ